MPTRRPPKPEREEVPLSEEEAGETFERLERITSGLLRVPKEELDRHLAAKREVRRRVKK